MRMLFLCVLQMQLTLSLAKDIPACHEFNQYKYAKYSVDCLGENLFNDPNLEGINTIRYQLEEWSWLISKAYIIRDNMAAEMLKLANMQAFEEMQYRIEFNRLMDNKRSIQQKMRLLKHCSLGCQKIAGELALLQEIESSIVFDFPLLNHPDFKKLMDNHLSSASVSQDAFTGLLKKTRMQAARKLREQIVQYASMIKHSKINFHNITNSNSAKKNSILKEMHNSHGELIGQILATTNLPFEVKNSPWKGAICRINDRSDKFKENEQFKDDLIEGAGWLLPFMLGPLGGLAARGAMLVRGAYLASNANKVATVGKKGGWVAGLGGSILAIEGVKMTSQYPLLMELRTQCANLESLALTPGEIRNALKEDIIDCRKKYREMAQMLLMNGALTPIIAIASRFIPLSTIVRILGEKGRKISSGRTANKSELQFAKAIKSCEI